MSTSAQLGAVAAGERAARLERRMAAAEARLAGLDAREVADALDEHHGITAPDWMEGREVRDIPDVPVHFRGKR